MFKDISTTSRRWYAPTYGIFHPSTTWVTNTKSLRALYNTTLHPPLKASFSNVGGNTESFPDAPCAQIEGDLWFELLVSMFPRRPTLLLPEDALAGNVHVESYWSSYCFTVGHHIVIGDGSGTIGTTRRTVSEHTFVTYLMVKHRLSL